MNRVVITGLGAVSALGVGAQKNFAQASAGISGVNQDMLAMVTENFEPELARSEASMFDRVARMGWSAAKQAFVQSGLPEDDQGSIFWGTGFGGATTIDNAYRRNYVEKQDRAHPFTIMGIMSNAPAALIALKTRWHGTSMTYSTACASSAMAIGEAYRHIKHGYSEYALAGGSECMLNEASIKCWESLQTLARPIAGDIGSSCRPFSKNRSGFVLGEGAAAFMLESLESAQQRGAEILGEIVGYGTSTDAVHITKPDAAGQAQAMRLALQEADINVTDIAYINAHGTGTVNGDIAETQSVKMVFDKPPPMSSTKAIHGHLIGASGALELLITVMAQRNNFAPPTAGLTEPVPVLDLDYIPNVGREMDMPYVMSNSFAFGGSNAVLIVKKYV